MATIIKGSDNFNTNDVASQTELDAKVQTAIVTVNGGANIAANSRYVEVNPFGNTNYEKCLVKTQVWSSEVSEWMETIWSTHTTITQSYGFVAYSTPEGIVVQTANTSIVHNGPSYGGASIDLVNDITSAPCRVIVTYVKGVA